MLPAHDTMNIWNSVKRRMQTKRAKAIKKKALAAGKLVGAGAALTGGSLLLEEVVKPGEPQLAGHDIVYATENGATLFKYKTLASEEDGISTSEIIGYGIIAISLVIFSIVFARIILRIRRTCRHNIDSKEFSDTEDTALKGNHDSQQPSDKTLEDTNQHRDFSLEEAMKKAKENYENLSAIRQNTIPG